MSAYQSENQILCDAVPGAFLDIRGLCFTYEKNGSAVLKNISLQLEKGQIGVLLGRNGSGKTTLFKNILGLETPFSGTMLLGGRNLRTMRPSHRARCVAYVPQQTDFGNLSVLDTVLTGRIAGFGWNPGKEDLEKAMQAIRELGLEAFVSRDASRLSGGEKQKVAIARAVAGEPELVVFDEPTGNLDLANGHLLLNEARKLAEQKNIAVLCSLHDLNEALALGDRFFFLKDGEIRYAGGKELFTEEILEEIFEIPMEILQIGGRTLTAVKQI